MRDIGLHFRLSEINKWSIVGNYSVMPPSVLPGAKLLTLFYKGHSQPAFKVVHLAAGGAIFSRTLTMEGIASMLFFTT
jgi:hypothetical protein